MALITTSDEQGNPYGFAASSLASLSAEPPLATVNLALSSSTAQILQVGSPLALHALSKRERNLAEQLAGPRGQRFESSGWSFELGVPVHDAVATVALGQVVRLYQVEQALIVVIELTRTLVGEAATKPLVYYNREYLD